MQHRGGPQNCSNTPTAATTTLDTDTDTDTDTRSSSTHHPPSTPLSAPPAAVQTQQTTLATQVPQNSQLSTPGNGKDTLAAPTPIPDAAPTPSTLNTSPRTASDSCSPSIPSVNSTTSQSPSVATLAAPTPGADTDVPSHQPNGNPPTPAANVASLSVPNTAMTQANGGTVDAADLPTALASSSPAPTNPTAAPASSTPPVTNTASTSTASSAPPVNIEANPNGLPPVDPNTTSTTDADGDWSSDDWMADMRRVKVYELVGARWTDRGTALCTGVYDEELDQAAIVAKSEFTDVELLRSEIRVSDVYQRQQGEGSNHDENTLIVWTEPDGTDYALSFQDVEGCAEIWDFIVEVQRHFRGKNAEAEQSSPAALSSSGRPNGDSSSPSQSRFTVASIISAGRLPKPALGILGDIDRAIKVIGRTASGKERICEYILTEDYIRDLIDVLGQAEDLESLEDLHALFCLMQTILSMNDHGIYDFILQEDVFMGVVGILEYDPEFPTFKANYRAFLTTASRFKQVIDFRDESVQKKIHQTYRLQYLKDVVLARALDDPTFNVLSSFILFNQIDIINHIQHDERFLADLFSLFLDKNGPRPTPPPQTQPQPSSSTMPTSSNSLTDTSIVPTDPETLELRRTDAIHLIHHLTLMGKNVQIPARLALYRALVDRGLLFAIEWALSKRGDQAILSAAGEVLVVIVDHDAGGVRAHILGSVNSAAATTAAVAASVGGWASTAAANSTATGAAVVATPTTPPSSGRSKPPLMQSLMAMLGGSRDLAFRSQMADSLRMLLELPNLDHHVGGGEAAGPAKSLAAAKLREDPVTEKFLQYFYDSCITTLYKPLLDLPEYKNVTDSTLPLHREQASLILYLSDLLCTFFLQHSHRSQYFILSSSIVTRIMSLFKARDKHVRLAALRFFRVCLRTSNTFVYKNLFKHDVFSAILDLTSREARRDNLLSSSCQEFFETVRKDNMKSILNHLMERNLPAVKTLSDVEYIGDRFKLLIRRWEQNNEPPPAPPTLAEKESDTSRQGRNTSQDAEEESYFNTSDDEDSTQSHVNMPPTSNTLKRKRRGSGNVVIGRANPVLQRPQQPRLGPGPIVVPKPHAIRIGLVDYPENDDDEHGEGENEAGPSRTSGANVPALSPSPLPNSPTSSPSPASSPPSPNSQSQKRVAGSPERRLARTVSIHADDSTSLLSQKPSSSDEETLLFATSAPLSDTLEGPPTRLAEKRRRDDDDDEMMDLLVKGKRPMMGKAEQNKAALHGKDKEEGSKKIKVALKGGLNLSSSPMTPPPGNEPPTAPMDEG